MNAGPLAREDARDQPRDSPLFKRFFEGVAPTKGG
jgi:hypothetical protein